MIAFSYIRWHYSEAFTQIFRIWGSYLWFIGHFFGVAKLFKTLLQPWKRLHEKKGSIIQFQEFAASLTVNILMRLVGLVARTVVIIISLFAWVFLLVFGAFFVVLWALAPAAIVYSIIHGVILLF